MNNMTELAKQENPDLLPLNAVEADDLAALSPLLNDQHPGEIAYLLESSLPEPRIPVWAALSRVYLCPRNFMLLVLRPNT